MNLAYVGKLAKDYNGVMFRLIRQELFDRIVEAKGMKTKVFKETVNAFQIKITKFIRPTKLRSTKQPNLLGSFKTLQSWNANLLYYDWH